MVMESERAARLLSEERLFEIRNSKLAAPQRATLENLFANIAEGQKPTLQMVLKGDVQGSVEALVGALKEATEQDYARYHPFGGRADHRVRRSLGERLECGDHWIQRQGREQRLHRRKEGVQIKLYSIIYELIDQVKEAMAGMLEAGAARDGHRSR